MKIILFSLYPINTLDDGYIFVDFVKKLNEEGHELTVLVPHENRNEDEFAILENIKIHRLACGAIQKTSSIRKVISLSTLDRKSTKLLSGTYKNENFDMAICMISHCAFYNSIKYLSKKKNTFIYNFVKDIFPENAVGLGILKKHSLIYKYFKSREIKYYKRCDAIGVVSPKCVEVLKQLNPKLDKCLFEVNPNSIYPRETILNEAEKLDIRHRYGIPDDAIMLVYGGNLGKPQGIDFLIDCIRVNEKNENANIFYLIVGNGTEFSRLQATVEKEAFKKAKLYERVASEEFDRICAASDAGLVFLDKRFTVPNYPSRILTYMQAKIPILFAVDEVCDAGLIATENGYGLNCINGDLETMLNNIEILVSDAEKRKSMGRSAYDFLCKEYSVDNSYRIIMSHFMEKNQNV